MTSTALALKASQYQNLAIAARDDDSYDCDLAAALLAPSVFLANPLGESFEHTFDKILFHLENAYQKAGEIAEDKAKISRITEEIFHCQVLAIQSRINQDEKKNSSLLADISSSLTKLPNALFSINPLAKVEVGLGISLDVFQSFVKYINEEWEIKKDKKYFYSQTANIYQKVIKSNAFDARNGLIRNTFKAKKEELLTYLVTERNLTSALALTQYDINEEEKSESARIIHKALMIRKDWDGVISFMKKVKQHNLFCLEDLKRDSIEKWIFVQDGGTLSPHNYDKISALGKKWGWRIIKWIGVYYATFMMAPFAFILAFVGYLIFTLSTSDATPITFKYVCWLAFIGAGWGIIASIGFILLVASALVFSYIIHLCKRKSSLSKWKTAVQEI